MKYLLAATALFGFLTVTSSGAKSERPLRDIAKLSYNECKFSLLDAPQSLIVGHISDLTVEGRYANGSENHATFTFARSGHAVGKIDIDDLYNPNGWFTVAPDSKAFAITWSDGGAIGNFHTRVFVITPRGKIEEQSAPVRIVMQDFESHHYCKARGDNFLAVRWLTPHELLLEASVYPTSDCGSDLGYTDRYAVRLTSGQIEQKVHVRQ